MKEPIYIKTYLDNLKAIQVSQEPDRIRMHLEKINVVEWLYNNGELRTEAEIETKLNSLKEEVLVFEFAENKGIEYKIAKSKLNEMAQLV